MMPQAQIIRCSASFTGNGKKLPKLAKKHPMENGALLIVTKNSLSTGTPITNGTLLANIVHNPSLVDIPNVRVTLTGDPTHVIFGRTALGGFYPRCSRGAVVKGDGGRVSLLDGRLPGYVEANIEHDYYIYTWQHIVTPLSCSDHQALITASQKTVCPGGIAKTFSASERLYATHVAYGRNEPTLSLNGTQLGFDYTGALTLSGPMRYSIGARFSPTINAAGLATSDSNIIAFGAVGPGNYDLCNSNPTLMPQITMPSAVLYEYGFIDLTVAGMTYAEMKALEDALYIDQVLTPGGQYYGDAWVEP